MFTTCRCPTWMPSCHRNYNLFREGCDGSNDQKYWNAYGESKQWRGTLQSAAHIPVAYSVPRTRERVWRNSVCCNEYVCERSERWDGCTENGRLANVSIIRINGWTQSVGMNLIRRISIRIVGRRPSATKRPSQYNGRLKLFRIGQWVMNVINGTNWSRFSPTNGPCIAT